MPSLLKCRRTLSHSGSPYFCCAVPVSLVGLYLQQMRSHMTEARYRLLTANKKDRDGDEYHLTVVNPNETKSMSASAMSGTEGHEFVFDVVGLGRLQTRDHEAWYLVVDSADIQAHRGRLGLLPNDLHITLGFDPSDIHDQKKDASTLV